MEMKAKNKVRKFLVSFVTAMALLPIACLQDAFGVTWKTPSQSHTTEDGAQDKPITKTSNLDEFKMKVVFKTPYGASDTDMDVTALQYIYSFSVTINGQPCDENDENIETEDDGTETGLKGLKPGDQVVAALYVPSNGDGFVLNAAENQPITDVCSYENVDDANVKFDAAAEQVTITVPEKGAANTITLTIPVTKKYQVVYYGPDGTDSDEEPDFFEESEVKQISGVRDTDKIELIEKEPTSPDQYFSGWEMTQGQGDLITKAFDLSDSTTRTKFTLDAYGIYTLKLYAVFSDNPSVTYVNDGPPATADGLPKEKQYEPGTTVELEEGLTAAGYTFNGWVEYLPEGATAVDTDKGNFTMPARNVTFKATWEAIQYTLKYVDEDGTTEIDTFQVATDTVVTILDGNEKCSKTGYEFNGWEEVLPNGATAVYIDDYGNFIMPARNVTFKATYSAKNYEIRYSFAETPSGLEDKLSDRDKTGSLGTFEFGSEDGGEISPPTGWIIAHDAGITVKYASDSSQEVDTDNIDWVFDDNGKLSVKINSMPADDVVITVPVTKEYQVTFDLQGGSDPDDGTYDAQTVRYGEKAKAPQDPTRTGYIFMGWGESADANITVNVGNTVITEPTTFYALWFDENDTSKCTVKFYMNDETADVHSTVVVDRGAAWSEVTSNLSEPKRVGFEFVGWGKSATSTTEATFPDTVTENLEYYAIWKECTYTIVYKANGGTGEDYKVDDQTLAQLKNHVLKEVTDVGFEKADKVFNGWALTDTVDDDSTVLDPGDVLSSFNSDLDDYIDHGEKQIVIYAVWGAVPTYAVTIQYVTPGNLLSPDDNDVGKFEQNAGVAITISVPDGYILDPSEEICVEDMDAATIEGLKVTFEMPAKNVFITVPVTKEYQVTFDLQGGSDPDDGTYDAQTVRYGEKAKAPKDPTQGGHIFVGWGKSADANITVNVGNTVITEPTTFYALWIGENDTSKRTVTFYRNDKTQMDDGTPAVHSKVMVDSGAAWSKVVSNLSEPERVGFEFVGWGKSSDATTEATFPDTVTENLEYYAIWSACTYTIVYNANDDDGTNSSFANQTLAELKDHVLKDVTEVGFTKAGSVFKGWALTDTVDDDSTVLAPGRSLSSFNSDLDDYIDHGEKQIVIYAVWGDELDEDPSQDDKYDVTIKFTAPAGVVAPEAVDVGEFEQNADVVIDVGMPEGYIFDDSKDIKVEGVDTEIGEEGISFKMPAQDVVITVPVTKEYRVSYELAGGSAPAGVVYGQSVVHGEKATQPEDPIPPEDQEFLYWALHGQTEEYDFDLPVTENITLRAQYNTIGNSGSNGGGDNNPNGGGDNNPNGGGDNNPNGGGDNNPNDGGGNSLGGGHENNPDNPPYYGASHTDDRFIFVMPADDTDQDQVNDRPDEIEILVRHSYYHINSGSVVTHDDLAKVTVPVTYDGGVAKIAVKDIVDQTCADCNDQIHFESYRCAFDRNNDGYVSDDLIRQLAVDAQDGELSMGMLIVDMEYYLYNNDDIKYYQVVHNYSDHQSKTKYTVTEEQQSLADQNKDGVVNKDDINISDYVNTNFKGKEYSYKTYHLSYDEDKKLFMITLDYEFSGSEKPVVDNLVVNDADVDIDNMSEKPVDTGKSLGFEMQAMLIVLLLSVWFVGKKTQHD